MTAFIKQEATEKAREIEIKANEEFAIEKAKLVRQETDAIDSAHAKRLKLASMSQQKTRSAVANRTRLRVLEAQQAVLDAVFEAAAQRLPQVAGAADRDRYRAVLKGYVLEGLALLEESELRIRARKADYDVVKEAIEAAAAEYKDKHDGVEVEATIDEENPLPEGW